MKYLTTPLRFAAALSFVLITVALLTPLNVRAQEGAIVRSIEIQYVGPETVSRERILDNLRTRVGSPYSETTVEDDIRNLYKTGAVQNVRMYGEPQANGVKVMVIVATRVLVTEIEIDGAESIKPQKVRARIKFKVPGPAKEETLEEGRQNIIDLYQRKGFTGIDVQFRLQIDEARGTARAIYTINEGPKGAVRAVRFEGNVHFSERTLRRQMKTKAKSIISIFDKSGRLDNQQLQQDLDSLREFYQNHGYIEVAIKDVRQEHYDGSLRLVIVIAEGLQYHVGKLTIVGQQAGSADKIRAILKMKEGSVYSPKALHDDAKAVTDAYGAGGYVDVQLLPQGIPAGPGVVDLTYTVDEGGRSFVERVNIVGNTRTKDKVIRREILIAPGDVFNTVRVDRSKQRLENLGYFSKVDTFPEDTTVPGRKDLLVQLEEKRTGSLNFGAGFSTIDSLVGFVELTQGNFDLFNWPTFTGGGEKFRARVQYGTERQDYVLSLTEPYFLDRPLSLGGEAFYHESDFFSTVYNQRNYGFNVDLRRPITSFASISLDYRLEEIDIFDVDPTASSAIMAEEGSHLQSQVGTTLLFDTRDNVFLTRRGTRVIFTPYVAGGFLGGNTQVYGFSLAASQYFLLPYDTILLLDGEAATVDTWGSGDRVPIFDRLFLGGANNLRGFDFRDVGPKDEQGEPLGGQTLARITIEYTVPIIAKVRGAIFYDTGFVNTNSYDFGTSHIASDVGVGLRLDLPIGPLRIDYGYPIQKDNNTNGGKINFNVGYQF
jgi:outer membrane protein insertion porin family